MYISSPEEVNEFVKGITKGEFMTPKDMRAALAKAGGAEHTCPVSTGIFLRIASEAAYEEHLRAKTCQRSPHSGGWSNLIQTLPKSSNAELSSSGSHGKVSWRAKPH